ncbi:hypothetical protein ACHAXA_002435 [Cyclostephanos tholiformis]|uniref:Uncharacterized protein n=1 Tax=Cyclostephanos tholiformis TaxID=382380 RepID=A0ABD3R5S0_9STRA
MCTPPTPNLMMESKDNNTTPPLEIGLDPDLTIPSPSNRNDADEVDDNDPTFPTETMSTRYGEVTPEFHEDGGYPSSLSEQSVSPWEPRRVEVEDENDGAPLPPDTIAASYEAVKLGLTHDVTDPPISSGQTGGLFERNDDQESSQMELEVDDDIAPLTPFMIAASFEKNEEEKRVDAYDDYAPVPPEMSAAFYDVDVDVDNKEKKKSELIEDYSDGNVNSNNGQNISGLNTRSGTVMSDINTDFLPDCERPVETENREERLSIPSSSQAGAISVFLSPQSTSDPNLPISRHGQGEIAIDHTPDMTPAPGLSINPSPLPEATLVEDAPQEPVYDAIPMILTEDIDANGQSRRFHKYSVIGVISVVSAAIIAGVVVSIVGLQNKQSESKNNPPSLWEQQGVPVFGDNDGDALGWSLALSADSKTLVVGAPGHIDHTERLGYVKVYYTDKRGGNRTQLGQTIHGNVIGDYFGFSVGVTANGKILAVGSPGYFVNEDRPGYVQVYHLESSVEFGPRWEQLGQNITGEAIGDGFGRSVSLSDDGMTIAVGAWLHDMNGDDSGQVRVYHLEDGVIWEQRGQDINGDESESYAGLTVSLSADGLTVAIGAPYYGRFVGYTRVYSFNSEGSSWETLGQTIFGDADNDCSGTSVDITADGLILAIGSSAYESDDHPGYVKVYYLESIDSNNFNWQPLGQKINAKAVGDEFGTSVSLSKNGRTLAVGAYAKNSVGHRLVRILTEKQLMIGQVTLYLWQQMGSQ